MPEELFSSFQRLAVLVYWVQLPVLQWTAFGRLARSGDPDGRSVRDRILAVLVRVFLVGLALIIPPFAIWAALRWSTSGWGVLVGGEILVAYTFLATGLTGFTIRLALGLMEKVRREDASRSLFLLRVSVLVAGGAYGVAVWLVRPGGPGETLIAVSLLGVGLLGLGLNRTGTMPAELMERLARHLRRR